MKYKIENFLTFLDQEKIHYSFKGNQAIIIDGFCPLQTPKRNQITWIKKPETFDLKTLADYSDLLVVTTFEGEAIYHDTKQAVLYCENPKEVYFMILTAFFDTEKYQPGIHATAVVESKTIGREVFIGCHTYIGKDVEIGNGVIIKNNVSIEGKVVIGDNTIIQSGCIIGLEGFGFYKNEQGNNTRVPHFGGVKIGHDVEIGPNVVVSRGTMNDTVIGNYVKIDMLSRIGHNVTLEDNCIVIVATLSGSVYVGENSYIGVDAVVKNQVKIGKNCLIGMGAVVTKDVDDMKVVAGLPAKVIRDNN
ncbi:MAG: DapH/DapD/GlmU-related protein [Eubacterium sp.]